MSGHDYFMKRPLSPLVKREVRKQQMNFHCFDDMRPEYLRYAIVNLFIRPFGEGICPYCDQIVAVDRYEQNYSWHIISEECKRARE